MKIIDKYRYTVPTNRSNLRIGLLGYNSRLSIEGVKQLAKNNKEQIEYCKFQTHKAYIRFKDGSTIEDVWWNGNLYGKRFDQLILFDDNRWSITSKRADSIQKILNQTMCASKVDPEWQVVYYEDVNRFER